MKSLIVYRVSSSFLGLSIWERGMARVFRYPSLSHKDRHRERGEWRWEKMSNELACGSAFYHLSKSKKKLTHVVVAVLSHSDNECE